MAKVLLYPRILGTSISTAFGTQLQLLMKSTPVYVGVGFWHRLTGDSNFYYDLITAFAEVADEMDSTELIQQVLQNLADELR